MKKHFILLSTFAALLLSATLLTGCGEDVQELADNGNNNSETVTETTVGENCTLFSTGDDGTRTALGADRLFYWSGGDQIYVNTDGANYKKTSSSTLSSNKRTADFVLEGVSLTAERCSVMYIGNGTTAATATKNDLKVKIEATQTQAAWGDSAHIGRAGDCGVAEATRDPKTGKYSFNLRHKAAYLVFQPYRAFNAVAAGGNPDWKLTKIEVIANGTTLAGTYDFGTGELVGTGSSDTIEFNCGTDGFDFTHSEASTAKSCFVVIEPGYHTLTIRYTVKVTKKPDVLYFDAATVINEDGIYTFDKPIPARQYAANVVTIIKHRVASTFSLLCYPWGSPNPYNPISNPYSEIVGADLTMSSPVNWAGLPNANELAWYVLRGNPHWDNETVWSPNGGLHEYTGGIWLMKRNLISGFTAARDPNGRNLPTTMANYLQTPISGKPANTTNYFFLPAVGWNQGGGIGEQGEYWTRSACGSMAPNCSYSLFFNDYAVSVYVDGYRGTCLVVAPDWFK